MLPQQEVRHEKAEVSYGLHSRVQPAMSADQEPLEFLGKQPWLSKKGTEDPDEEDEEDRDAAKNGFSLEEVLRLGGTKVRAAGSGEGDAHGCQECGTCSPTSDLF